jgi:hypothetical protein
MKQVAFAAFLLAAALDDAKRVGVQAIMLDLNALQRPTMP